jgi:hypothetical protein
MLTLHPATMQLPQQRVRGLEAWIRNQAAAARGGGRRAVHPVGGAAGPQVTFARSDYDTEENRGLLSGDAKKTDYVTVRLGWVGGIMGATLILVSLLAIAIVVFMLIFAQMATGMITDAQTAFMPTGMKLLDSVDTIADEAVSILQHGHNISEQTDNVAAVGAADILTLLNSSAALSTRVQHLLEHPKLEIALKD